MNIRWEHTNSKEQSPSLKDLRDRFEFGEFCIEKDEKYFQQKDTTVKQ